MKITRLAIIVLALVLVAAAPASSLAAPEGITPFHLIIRGMEGPAPADFIKPEQLSFPYYWYER
jgi:hypothetical protein